MGAFALSLFLKGTPIPIPPPRNTQDQLLSDDTFVLTFSTTKTWLSLKDAAFRTTQTRNGVLTQTLFRDLFFTRKDKGDEGEHFADCQNRSDALKFSFSLCVQSRG